MTKTRRIVIRVSEEFFERASAFLARLKPTHRTKLVGDRLVSLAMQEKRRQDRNYEKKRARRAQEARDNGNG